VKVARFGVSLSQLAVNLSLTHQPLPLLPATMTDLCPVYAPFFGAMVSSTIVLCKIPGFIYLVSPSQGCTSAIVFTCTSYSRSRASRCLLSTPYQVSERGKSCCLLIRARLPDCTTFLIGTGTCNSCFPLQLWDRKIWRRNFSHGCTTTGSHDEKRCSRHHGRYHSREW
jgi:hypothetical protein